MFTAIGELWAYINVKRKCSNPRCMHLYRLLVWWAWGQVKTLEWKAENHINKPISVFQSHLEINIKLMLAAQQWQESRDLCCCETTKDAIDILIENIMSEGMWQLGIVLKNKSVSVDIYLTWLLFIFFNPHTKNNNKSIIIF